MPSTKYFIPDSTSLIVDKNIIIAGGKGCGALGSCAPPPLFFKFRTHTFYRYTFPMFVSKLLKPLKFREGASFASIVGTLNGNSSIPVIG